MIQESKVLVFEDDPKPAMMKKQRAIMYDVFYKSTRLLKAIKLIGQKTVITTWDITMCFPEIFQEVTVRGLMLHHDNVSSHTERLTVEFLEQKCIKVMRYLPYSPDLAVSDFF